MPNASDRPPEGRLVIDVSTLARWVGPPVGMIRVEHEVAMAARAGGEPFLPAFLDPRTQEFRALAPDWIETLLGWRGAIDGWGLDYRFERRGWRRFVPSRYPLFRALERARLTARRPLVARALDAAQRLLLAGRGHSLRVRDGDGARIAHLPADLALGDAHDLGPGDTVLSPASDWLHKDVAAIAALKARAGFRLVVVCYDVIPLTHPRFFPGGDVVAFTRFWRGMFAIADRVIVNSRAVRGAIEDYCAREAIAPPDLAVVPLGAQPPAREPADAPLPAGLAPGRFILFVSTIEPRKNHALLLRVWRELLRRGLPQSAGFTLVFVGRPGWMVDDVLRDIADTGLWQGALLHLRNVGDAELAALYRDAAFCVYPSVTEGFGLPVVEAFARGKAVIASNGGALPEVVGDLCPCLDPADDAAWTETIAHWIAHPETVAAAEARIRMGYVHRDWQAVAEQIIAAARE